MRSEGVGLAAYHCRYHVQFRARHGSHWCPTYRAAELKPYLVVASKWVRANRPDPFVTLVLLTLQEILEASGPVEPAMNLGELSASKRARVAFARLHRAGIEPTRLLSTHLAVSMLIEEDLGSHRTEEFKIVQIAKVAHRLASGTHRKWDVWQPNAPSIPVELHVYPKSSGRVLRIIGQKLDTACAIVAKDHLLELLARKIKRYGCHAPHLPGWRPIWARDR